MKLSISAFVVLALSSADAFAPMHMASRTPTLLRQTDSADAVAAAKEATEKFGATSPEARIAWELVEEIDAASSHVKSLEKAAKEAAAAAAAAEAKEEPCAEPTVRRDNSEAIKNALQASEIYGKSSKEARLAWELVEEMDAANSHHRSGDIHVTLEEECSTEEPAKLDNAQEPPKTVEEAIERATMMSEVYGKTSVDARMAWELVEEMDAAKAHTKAVEKAKAAREAEAAKPVEKKEVEQNKVYKDTSDAIAAALEASKTHGATSVEARMAWELVEEIDAANAHHKSVGSG